MAIEVSFYIKIFKVRREKVIQWIEEQLRERSWSQRELARQSGLSQTLINNVLNHNRNITWDFCAAVAKVFNEHPEKIFRLAGLLNTPDESDLKDDEKELLRLYQSLPGGLPKKYALIMLRAWVKENKDEDGVGE